MNAFDLVVTVALGSTLATVLLSADVALAEGMLGLVVLIGAPLTVAWTSVRSRRFHSAVKSSPTLLVWQGQLCGRALREQRVSRAEVLQGGALARVGQFGSGGGGRPRDRRDLQRGPRDIGRDLGALDDVPGLDPE